MSRKPYPSDVSDEEWAFVAPYLTLLSEAAPQREYSLREVFNGLRWLVRAGAAWRLLPHDLPPWGVVYQQMQRWLKAGVFEAMVHDLRALLRLAVGRSEQPSAAIMDSRTLQSTPESGGRAGDDGAKRKRGSKVHVVVHLSQLKAYDDSSRPKCGVFSMDFSIGSSVPSPNISKCLHLHYVVSNRLSCDRWSEFMTA